MSQSLCDSHNCKNNAVAKQELALINKRSEKEDVDEQRSTKRQRRKMATGWGHGP
jgi:predicted neutral ceramidase superfamily lipid hydrolase